MKPLDGSSTASRRTVGFPRTHWTRKLTVAVTALALIFSQTAPALAYRSNGAFAGHNDVRAMGYFRIPLGAFQADKDRVPSFGFTVKRQFQFNDPLSETMSGSYQNSNSLTIEALDLRFGMNGKLIGFDVGGVNALKFKTHLNAAADGGEGGGIPTWVWWVGGGAAVLGIAVVAVQALPDDSEGCNPFFGGGNTNTPECLGL